MESEQSAAIEEVAAAAVTQVAAAAAAAIDTGSPVEQLTLSQGIPVERSDASRAPATPLAEPAMPAFVAEIVKVRL